MKRRVVIVSVLILAAAIIGTYLIHLLLAPKTTEIERIFSGDEAAFIETSGLSATWNSLKETRYARAEGYRPFFEIAQVKDLLDKLRLQEAIWGKGIDAESVMGLLGNESALGIYPDEGSMHLLFVSRVEPNFLLMERLFVFTQSGEGVTVTRYRTVRVKEAAIADGQRLWYTLDGNLLILSDDRDLFFSALDRSLDGESGGLSSVPSFRKLARERRDGTLISGFIVKEKIIGIPGIGEVLSDTVWVFTPQSFRFSLASEGDIVTLTVRGEGVWPILPKILSGKREETSPEMSDIPVLLSVGRLPEPFRKEITSMLPVKKTVITLAPSLFPEGFSAYLSPDPERRRPPAVVVVGEWSPSFGEFLEQTIHEEGLLTARESAGGIDMHTYTKDGVGFLSWAEADGKIVVSEGPDQVVHAVSESLVKKGSFGYNMGNDGLRLTVRPRLVSDELERFPDSAAGISWGLSPADVEKLFLALYPVDELDAGLSVTGGTGEVTVDVRVEDRLP